MFRPSPPLFSSLPPTIRAVLARSGSSTTPATASVASTVNQPDPSSTSASEAVSGAQTVVRGWVKSIRAHKNVSFAAISDGSSSEVLQAVFKGDALKPDMTVGTSLELYGKLGRSRGKGQSTELVVEETTVLGICDPQTYPIQKKHLPDHYLRDHAHLRFRTTQTGALMRVRDAIMRDWHDWFEDNEFIYIHTPILTSSDCEGAGEVFTLKDNSAQAQSSGELNAESTSTDTSTIITSLAASIKASSYTSADPDDSTPDNQGIPQSNTPPSPPPSPSPPSFFPHPVNLTVSSQLHLECPTHALSRTYTLSPSFRAEPSMTSRHLSEFYMFEAEVAHLTTLDQLLDIVEASIKGTLSQLLSNTTLRSKRTLADLEAIKTASIPEGEDIPQISVNLANLVNGRFVRKTYTDVMSFLSEVHTTDPSVFGGIAAPVWGEGLGSEHEKWLAGHYRTPVFVTHYPTSLKPFYMLPSSADPAHSQTASTPGETVACFDLLLPGLGELVGGSVREHRLPQLVSAIERHGLKKEEYEWYLDLRRYGSVPHGGWGMGWERWISYVTGISNVRDVVAFPRWIGHCKY